MSLEESCLKMNVLKVFVLLTSVCSGKILAKIVDSKFPDEFLFGAATSALQVEGAWNTDGKGPNVWDIFTHEHPDKIEDGRNTGDIADSYYFYEKDIEAIKSMGMNHYRFSISWSRILPDGNLGSINQAGIAYYNKLIDALLKNEIKPVVTIFHFDVPQTLQNLGGFTSDVAVDFFQTYADLVFSLYGDRVKTWITINEPFIFCTMTYGTGWLSPTVEPVCGISEYLCGHNVLKAHAVAYRMYQSKYAAHQNGEVGISQYANYFYSDTNDEFAVKRAVEFQLGWFCNPIFSREGNYPKIMREEIGNNSIGEGLKRSRLPVLSDYWIEQLRGSADFMGLNYYTSRYIQPLKKPAGASSSYEYDRKINYTVKPEWKRGKSSFMYSVPSGLGDLLRYVRNEYNNPKVFITENGWSDDGELNDQNRIDYLRTHLQEVLNAVNRETNLIGYTVWSLIDTFEFNDGLIPRFGLFAVNFTIPEKTRTPKASADFMHKVISSRRIPLN